jgi:Tfp pilus assembly protein PilE
MKKGLTMIELMFVVAILVFVIAGMLVAYVNCLTLNEHNLKFSIGMNVARRIMEEVYYRKSDWDWIHDYQYNEAYMSASYSVQGYSAAIVVNNTIDPMLKVVTVVVCWREKGGRIIGEDDGAGVPANRLNGRLDSGEDRNGDGRLTSRCEITTAIVKI